MVEKLPAPPVDLAELGARAATFARTSRSAATERIYRSDWADFSSWCERAGLPALPTDPTTVGVYLSERAATLRVVTLGRRLAAITAAHRTAGLGLDSGHPAIARVLAGIRRTYGTRQVAKTALLTEDLRRVVRALPADLAGVRDKALLLIGFAGAFRRSELSALDLSDITLTAGGVIITIRRSKTDQEGAGRQVGIPRSRKASPTCPVAALEAWLQQAEATGNNRKLPVTSEAGLSLGVQPTKPTKPTNPLFRAVIHGKPLDRLSGQAIARIVKRAVERVGFDPSQFAGHSLRSGFATSAARGGADLAFIMMQTGHRNADVARRYVHAGTLLQNPASKAVRL